MGNKKGSVLIYAIVLTTIALILSSVLLANNANMINTQNYYKLNTQFFNQIKSNNNLNIDYLKSLNSDGSGFIDQIGCPINFTMSGTTVLDNNIDTNLVYSGGLTEKFFCSGIFNSKKINFYFNSDFSDLEKTTYDNSQLLVNSGTLNYYFTNSENTYLSLENKSNYYYQDGYDDNFNSDNYLLNNTGSLSYTGGYQDNDDLARKQLIGIIKPGQQKNIFWNNKYIEEYIDNNPNNYNSFNKTLSGVTDGRLYLDINTGALLTLIEYDKNRYNNFGEIKEIKSFTGVVSGSGYMKKNSVTKLLELDKNPPPGLGYSFNFSGNGYLLFLSNTGSNLMSYNLSGYENTGSGIYLNTINDDISNTGSIEILGYDVIINNKGEIFGKMLKKVFDK